MLVGANENLPSDPAIRYREDGDIVGCNRIICNRCGASVRNVAGYRIDEPTLSRDEHLEFYETLAAGALPKVFVTAGSGGELYRVYACRCDWADTPSIKRIVDTDQDGWCCQGHPDAGV